MATRLGAPTELVVVSTRGDRDTASTIHALGGTGVFVKEVQDAVLRGDADLAVHSAKDLPAETPDGSGPRRGTGAGRSARRARGLPARRPADRWPRRDRKRAPAGPARRRCGPTSRSASCAATSRPASSGRWSSTRSSSPRRRSTGSVSRTGPTERLDPSTLLPQVGQGALAVECRADDAETIDALAAIDDLEAARGDPGRAGVPRPARRWLQPARAVRWPAGADGTGRSCSTRCSRRSTGASCCGCAARDPIRMCSAPTWLAACSTKRAASILLDVLGLIPVGERVERR